MTDCSPIKTPMPTGNLLGPDLAGKPVDQKIYRSMIGSLLYLTATRPDIMFATCFCAHFQANPKESHLAAVKRILRYLKGTPELGLWYPKDSSFELISFTDSDYGGCKLDRKSTSGSCQFLGDKLVSWTSKKQNCVSTSTAEAEYVAAASCCSQVLWMKTQLLDYGYKLKRVPIYCDSESAIAITSNPVLHSKTKHIDIRYHFIKDNVEKGNIEMFFVQTDYQLADLFTKPLDEKRFNFLGEIVGCKIGLYPRSQVDAQSEDKGKVKEDYKVKNLNLEQQKNAGHHHAGGLASSSTFGPKITSPHSRHRYAPYGRLIEQNYHRRRYEHRHPPPRERFLVVAVRPPSIGDAASAPSTWIRPWLVVGLGHSRAALQPRPPPIVASSGDDDSANAIAATPPWSSFDSVIKRPSWFDHGRRAQPRDCGVVRSIGHHHDR
ncbi:hypothetical protein OSB04_031786 [Centaurea solstitialis]|uniref:Uncharacterized protein n=1 Tax=Centaurea solstitialis TaxID=347529 RepID=A0AA38SB26_9ASTR|nr:hypothetical protein OSB04_031786 [Centaurea solstitialis]